MPNEKALCFQGFSEDLEKCPQRGQCPSGGVTVAGEVTEGLESVHGSPAEAPSTAGTRLVLVTPLGVVEVQVFLVGEGHLELETPVSGGRLPEVEMGLPAVKVPGQAGGYGR